MEPQLVFGLRDGKATHISEVESGLICACVCPKCGRRLIAKKGEERVFHFAHEDDSDCQGAYESSLHHAAKEILQREKRVNLPLPSFLLPWVKPPSLFEFEEAKLEKRCGDFIPDIIAYKNGRSPLIIEIKVSNAVDSAKLEKIKELGISAIEVDLSGTDCSTFELIKENVIDSVQNKTWLYNAKAVYYQEQGRIWKRQHRLPASRYPCHLTVARCPITGAPKNCLYCEHLINFNPDNQSVPHYRENRNYVYCAKANSRN